MRGYSAGKLISWAIGCILVSLCLLAIPACRGPRNLSTGRGDAAAQSRYFTGRAFWKEKQFEPVSATIPTILKAEYVKDDDLCATCHESYVQYHKTNIHRDQSCENCHGPGSQHVRTRGQEPGTILSFKKMQPAERSE